MRYNEEANEIEITARELVATARRGVSTALPYDEDEPCYDGALNRESLRYPFEAGGYAFSLTSRVESATEGEICLRVPTDSSPRRPRREVVEQARGEGYIAAHIVAELYGTAAVKVRYVYENRQTGEKNEVEEVVGRARLSRFFKKCSTSTKVYAKPEIERVTKRLPSMRSVKFPFERVREGQSEIMQAVYKNVARGGRLFTSAPTGTGKTISMLYPAVRAMGGGKCSKIFYLTPKTTTANAARDCINKLCEAGAMIRALHLPSKDRACERGRVCKTSRSLCENSKCNKLSDAVIALHTLDLPVVGVTELRRVAREFRLCPHELALTYAEICDVVICDLNYLFDPAVYIRRFFTVGGDYAFLIDEAHNLPDRAREMYSAEITLEELISPAKSELFGEHSEVKNFTRVAADAFSQVILPYIKEELYKSEDGTLTGATHLSELPGELYGIFDELIGKVEAEIFKSYGATDEQAEARTSLLREYYYKCRAFREVMENYDTGYELFIFKEGEALRVKCFCIDPAAPISRRLDKGRSATFFSGTLTPTYYYRAVLGGDRTAGITEVESPFDESQLSVCIMDKISTRLSEREDTLSAVCRVIAATVSARRGNYMIFSPSFAYSEALAAAFRAKYPKIRVLEQRRNMSATERQEFLAEFERESPSYLIGFCVMGGIYSEGIDLAGESLIGAVVVGIGMPALSYEREAIAAYYDDRYEEGKQFAYIYPGINRVLQAAGRVIRREEDRGVIVLIDDRFDDPIYKKVIPRLWSGMRFISDPKALREELDRFWKGEND